MTDEKRNYFIITLKVDRLPTTTAPLLVLKVSISVSPLVYGYYARAIDVLLVCSFALLALSPDGDDMLLRAFLGGRRRHQPMMRHINTRQLLEGGI